MKTKKIDKGFTLTELVIVIVIIAILAAVLIPAYSGVVKKAKVSNDIQMVKNLNTTLKNEEFLDGVPDNMYGALQMVEMAGYSADKIEANADGNQILWDSVNNFFCYLNSGEIQYIGGDVDINPANCKYWVVVDTVDPDCEYSQYLRSTTLTGNVTVTKGGFDAGNNTSLTKVIVNNSTSNSITVRTNGGALDIYAPSADVYVGGTADTVTILAAAPNSVHIGEAFIKKLVMNDSNGHVVVESGAVISRLEANEGNIAIESGSTVSYLEANAGTINVADAGCVTQYYAAESVTVNGVSSTAKSDTKVQEVESCTSHTKATKEVGGNKVTYCSVCGDIISVERIGGGATTSGGDSGSIVKHPTSITLSGADKVNKGDTITLTATVSPNDAENKNVTWTSTNANIATVDENGVVTGVADGDATITAASKDPSTPGIAASKTITVIDTKKPTPTAITVSGTTSIEIGKTTELTATVAPENASTNVAWSSADTNIATVDAATGKVMGVSAGTVTITAISKVADTVKGTFDVTVTKPAPTSVAVTGSTTSVIVGGSLNLSASVSPYSADQSVTWTSADANIATVENGAVTGVAAGTVKITATSTLNNEIKGEISITVVAAPTNITISGGTSVEVGKSITLTASVAPEGTVQTVTWTSSNTAFATVDATGKVTGVKAGTATITAKAVNSVEKTIDITVTAPDPTSISIDGDTGVTVGNTITLTATVGPTGANQGVTWSSSDSTVATVDENGEVKGIKTGTVTITATSKAKDSVKQTKSITVTKATIVEKWYFRDAIGNEADDILYTKYEIGFDCDGTHYVGLEIDITGTSRDKGTIRFYTDATNYIEVVVEDNWASEQYRLIELETATTGNFRKALEEFAYRAYANETISSGSYGNEEDVDDAFINCTITDGDFDACRFVNSTIKNGYFRLESDFIGTTKISGGYFDKGCVESSKFKDCLDTNCVATQNTKYGSTQIKSGSYQYQVITGEIWLIRETINNDCLTDAVTTFSTGFISEDRDWSKLVISKNEQGSKDQAVITYGTNTVCTANGQGGVVWDTEYGTGIRLVTFKSVPTGDLLTWLTANADKLGKVIELN